MARRSLLTPALLGPGAPGSNDPPAEAPPATAAEPRAAEPRAAEVARSTKPSRQAKLHIGGYYDPSDDTIVSFQKLGIDLRKPQQAMLYEAIGDYVAKHHAAKVFR